MRPRCQIDGRTSSCWRRAVTSIRWERIKVDWHDSHPSRVRSCCLPCQRHRAAASGSRIRADSSGCVRLWRRHQMVALSPSISQRHASWSCVYTIPPNVKRASQRTGTDIFRAGSSHLMGSDELNLPVDLDPRADRRDAVEIFGRIDREVYASVAHHRAEIVVPVRTVDRMSDIGEVHHPGN